jgi:hypothetical protein
MKKAAWSTEMHQKWAVDNPSWAVQNLNCLGEEKAKAEMLDRSYLSFIRR